jgi:hypothetical protein
MNHKELSELAMKWLKRPNSQKGHGCIISATELRSGWDGEIPDAIGFRLNGNRVVSIVVEAKASRSDFLADKAKAHRKEGGMGNFRYFICPEGLIQKNELPDGWGLLWVNKRGHIKPIEGMAVHLGNWRDQNENSEKWMREGDITREMWLLVRLLSRVGDIEQMNAWIKESKRLASKYIAECETLRKENKELSYKVLSLRNGVTA